MKALLLLLLLGCSHKIDVGPLDDLLPEADRSALHFVSRDVETGSPRRVRYRIAVPERWKEAAHGIFESSNKLDGSSVSVRSSCEQSPCKARDWNALIDRMLKEDYAPPERDERLDHRRIVSAKSREQDWVYLLVASWRDGEGEADICSVHLSFKYASALPAFEKACEAAVRLDEVKDEP